jgi:hypothetical protein
MHAQSRKKQLRISAPNAQSQRKDAGIEKRKGIGGEEKVKDVGGVLPGISTERNRG